MTIEITLDEAEIRSQLAAVCKSAVRDYVNEWHTSQRIKDTVRAAGAAAIKAIVEEAVKDESALRAEVKASMERSIRAKLQKAMQA